MSEHQHAHGPANRGRVVLTTAAPLFVCEPRGPVRSAVIALHGEHGITAAFEAGLRAIAGHGSLVAAPFHYFRDGGPEYIEDTSARTAYTRLSEEDIDVDVDAARHYLADRLNLSVMAVLGPPSATAAVHRAAARHPELAALTVPQDAAAWPGALTRAGAVR